ncbi:MAG: acyl-CoA dehydrogenase family protein [bacterium]|nr:acyl-CoA dehydrogenase family protein [bacterium]
MHFALTDEQKMVRDTARQFARDVLAPKASWRDETATFPHEELKQLADMGFCGIQLPEEFGGAGMDSISYSLMIEEISAGDASVGVVLSVTNSLAGFPIYKYGTQAQKEKYLPKLASGQWLGGFMLTEPEAGSDAGAQKTTAIDKGDHFVVNGTKQFITGGATADVFIVTCVTDPAKGSKGTSTLIIEKTFPGFIVGKHEDKMGIRGSDCVQIIFDNCIVPKENLLGELGSGIKIALSTLDSGRIGIASQALGIAAAAMNAAKEYGLQRKQFGQPITSFQAIRFKFADMTMKIDAARLLTHRACWLKDQGEPYSVESAMAKLYSSQICVEVANEGVQIHGGAGYMKDYPAERHLRDSKVCEIYEGTSEVQRFILSNALLGR